LRGIYIDPGITHEHTYLDHASETEDRILSGGVQTARKIEPDFASFDDALTDLQQLAAGCDS
jgi:hypothetical protein